MVFLRSAEICMDQVCKYLPPVPHFLWPTFSHLPLIPWLATTLNMFPCGELIDSSRVPWLTSWCHCFGSLFSHACLSEHLARVVWGKRHGLILYFTRIFFGPTSDLCLYPQEVHNHNSLPIKTVFSSLILDLALVVSWMRPKRFPKPATL